MYWLTQRKDDTFYRDMRDLADDRIVLTNPHKGWYLHFIDNGIIRKVYRDDINSPEDIKDIPGMKFLYLRIDWSDIEKEPNVFDWSYIDDIINTYTPYGYKFMFRFCTYESFAHVPMATPKWVFDEGAKCNIITQTHEGITEDFYEPVYNDAIFKKYLSRFIENCGQKFDGKDYTESVDIGTFGTFGEGHTFGGSRTQYDVETIKWHIDLHARCFKNSRLVVNDDMVKQPIDAGDVESGKWLADYCKGLNMGVRDDSINVSYFAENMGYDTLQTPELFDLFKTDTPVDLEFEHYEGVGAPERFMEGFRHIEAIKSTGASYAGFHGHITKWYKERKNLHEYLANRMGYWYFMNGFSLVPLIRDTKPILSIDIENKGFARGYYPYKFKVVLQDDNGVRNKVCECDAENQNWLPNKESRCRMQLDLSGIKAGKYKLLVGLFEGETPVMFALKNDIFDGNYYIIDEVTVE